MSGIEQEDGRVEEDAFRMESKHTHAHTHTMKINNSC